MAKIGYIVGTPDGGGSDIGDLLVSRDIFSEGGLWMWGSNSYGQLGDSTLTNRSSPIQTISRGTTWKQVSCTETRLTGIKTDGTLWNWGWNLFGGLGDSTTTDKSSPVQTITGGNTWKQAATGSYFTAAIKTDGTLWTWGNNASGQLGDSTTTDKSAPVQTISGGTTWKQVSCGDTFTAAVKTDGTLWTWGNNDFGQLGDGWYYPVAVAPMKQVSGTWSTSAFANTTFSMSYVTNYYASSFIKSDGTLWTCGYNNLGQLGDNTTTQRSSPVQTAAGGNTWKQVSLSDFHGAAVKTDGTLWTWGNNDFGQLGDSTTTQRSSPAQTISGGATWYQVSCGKSVTAAIKTDGTLWTWGYNAWGQLGDNTITNRSVPVQTISAGTTWKKVSCGYKAISALKTDGTLWTWGSNLSGELGSPYAHADSYRSSFVSSPIQTIAGGNTWKELSFNMSGMAAVKTDGTLWVWGDNSNYQLGLGSSFQTWTVDVPTQITGSTWSYANVANSSFSTSYSFGAVKTDGTLWVWGDNLYGQLGDSSGISRSSPVQTIAGGTNWRQISSSNYQTAAIKTDGTLWTWGINEHGSLGNSTLTSRSSPAQTITGGNTWKQVSQGLDYTAAVKTDGTLWTWGYNFYGQLGDSTTTDRSVPVQTISGGTTWKQVSGGIYHTAAIKTDGTLWAWGYNASGQLGDSTTTDRSVPVQTVFKTTTWRDVSCGRIHSAAIKTDGTLWTWGSNFSGELGDSTTTDNSAPVQTISRGTTWKQVSCGDSFTAAVKTDGTLWTWGNGSRNQLGNTYYSGMMGLPSSVPIQTSSLGTSWTAVSVSEQAIYGFKSDSTLWAWGNNFKNQLGILKNGQAEVVQPNQTITGGTTWKQASTGVTHTIAVKTDGTLWTWGTNSYGELGNTYTPEIKYDPTLIWPLGTSWVNVSADARSSFALKSDGSLWAFGCNYGGQLALNVDLTDLVSTRTGPVQTISRGNTWKEISISGLHSSAIKTDGTLWTWGDNGFGQLGDSTTTHRSSPVQTIAGGTNWKQVSSGFFIVSAIKTDGTLWTWGGNTYGALGDSTITDKSSPVQTIAGGSTWKEVSSSYCGSSAIKTDGTLWSWGMNNNGQLGDNSIVDKSSPVQTIAGGNNWRTLGKYGQSVYVVGAIKDDM